MLFHKQSTKFRFIEPCSPIFAHVSFPSPESGVYAFASAVKIGVSIVAFLSARLGVPDVVWCGVAFLCEGRLGGVPDGGVSLCARLGVPDGLRT